jgi:hypothetical protein
MSARAENRTRGAKATRKRTAAAMRSETNVVAFSRTPDAMTLAQNPNRGKRHAAKLENLPRLSKNQGARKRGETARMPYLEQTRNGRTLPLSKRPQKFETVREGQ